MPALPITNSPNISSLDTRVVASLCDGKFAIDISPSVYLGSGALNVLGASIKVVSPTGVTIKNYSTSGYDISGGSPAMQGVVEVNIPTIASNYQYGTYLVTAKLTDADGTIYTTPDKPVKICEPDKNHKTRNYGSLSAKLTGICKDGKLFVVADTPPNYRGETVDSQENDFKLEYPTVSLKAPEDNITIDSFSAQLYEGVYNFSGTICATYNFDDNVYIEVNYKVKASKDIKCALDECCVAGGLAELNARMNEACKDSEKKEYAEISAKALLLLKVIQLAAECSEDPSDYIAQLEALLGCKCTCNCAEGTPIINNNPAKDFVFAGCGFTKTTVGLTDYISLNNYGYLLSIPDNGGILVAESVSIQDCVVRMPITFDLTKLYTYIKGQASSDYNSWAAIVSKAWDAIDPVCLGLTAIQWQNMTFIQRGQALASAACAGGSCSANISEDTTNPNGSDVEIAWSENGGVYAVEVYVDDILAGTVLAGTASFIVTGKADGNAHTYSIIAKCANGVAGNALDGSFNYFGCPTIAPVTLTVSSVSDADCPYNLAPLVNALPSGIEVEWHNANNTNASSLVPNPAQVVSGTYYAFAKDGNNCYSLARSVIIVCSTETNCSAPQNLTVLALTEGFRISFISAAYPPPANSYTVKRKLASAPDVDGSYTTIGTPTYNSSSFRWEILDADAVQNVLYTYKAISNCSLSAPSVSGNYAHFDCPAVTLTPGDTIVSYSFTNAGGEIDKYEISIYDSTGTTLIHTNTHTPAFPSPITGTFVYLENGLNYKVRLKVFIGSYTNTICALNSVSTANFTVENESSAILNSVNPSGNYTVISGSFPIAVSGNAVVGTHGSFTAAFAVAGASAPGPWEVRLYKNDVLLETVTSVASSATLTFASVTFSSTDNIVITMNDTI